MKHLAPRKVLTALIRSQGKYSEAARMLHTSVSNINRIVEENPDLQEQFDLFNNDLFEAALESAKILLSVGDKDMTKFILSTVGAKRGFAKTRQVELSGNPNKPLQVERKLDLSDLNEQELLMLMKTAKKITGEEDETD